MRINHRCRNARRILFAAAVAALGVSCSDSAGPDFSNARIFFQDTHQGELDLFSMTPSGDSVVNLTNTLNVREQHPTVSPDRQTVIYSRGGQLWIMDADGGNQRPIPNLSPIVEASFPAWSRDGASVAYRSDQSGTGFAIWLATVGGQNARRLTTIDDGESISSWTRDGRVVFDDILGYLHVTNADGTGRRFLFTDTSMVDQSPAVSPDGNSITFTRQTAVGQNVLARVFVARLDGSQPVQIGTMPAGSSWTPAWSPDGTRVVFSHDVTGVFELWMGNADGTNVHQLPHTAGLSYRPAW